VYKVRRATLTVAALPGIARSDSPDVSSCCERAVRIVLYASKATVVVFDANARACPFDANECASKLFDIRQAFFHLLLVAHKPDSLPANPSCVRVLNAHVCAVLRA